MVTPASNMAIFGIYILLMVQKSQATTWNLQNPANNGISSTNLYGHPTSQVVNSAI